MGELCAYMYVSPASTLQPERGDRAGKPRGLAMMYLIDTSDTNQEHRKACGPMHPSPGASPPGAARRLVPRLGWLCYSLLLSLAAAVVLLPRAAVMRSSFMWRSLAPSSSRTSLVGSTAIGGARSPPLNYGDRWCQEEQLHPPNHNITDAQVYENLYRGFTCLVNTIVEPWIHSGASRRSASQPNDPHAHARCGDEEGGEGAPSASNMTLEEAWREGWRRLADQQLCVLVDSMYDAMVSSQHSLRRGMLIESSRYDAMSRIDRHWLWEATCRDDDHYSHNLFSPLLLLCLSASWWPASPPSDSVPPALLFAPL